MQALSLEEKIALSRERIIEWYQYWNGDVCISFSGGKDSTVLADLVHSIYPDVKCVFVNTGLEYPEIQKFVNQYSDSVTVRPEMDFKTVITEYGYPIISKETAECIYYARKKPKVDADGNLKIRNGAVRPVNQSRQMELLGKRVDTYGAGKTRRQRLLGTLGIDNSLLPPPTDGGELNINDRKHKRMLTGNYKRRVEGGPETGVKSKFNKAKWLPIARDLPARISHKCCDVMKKSPLNKYQRKEKVHPYLGTMADESRLRAQAWIRHGCNAFEGKKKTSSPMAFWTEQDVLEYIQHYGLKYATPYGDLIKDENGLLRFTGCDRTGCVYCGFGLSMEKGETRFERLKKTHPKLYDYSIGGGQWIDNPDFDPDYDGEPDDLGWIEWNPPKLWVPSSKGLGFGKIFDMANEIMANAGYKDEWRY